jgi:sulfide:quinone oxidoreductase
MPAGPQSARPIRVVIAGAGIAGLETALALRAFAGAGETAFDVTIVAPGDRLHYRPLTVVEPFTSRATRHYALDAICRDLGARLVRAAVAAVEPAVGVLVTDGGERIAYDQLVVATGTRAEAALPRAHTFFADADPQSLHWVVRELEEGALRRVAFVAPAGHCWPLPLYELALMTAARVHDMGVDDAELTLVTPEDKPLAIFNGAGSAAVAELLREAGIAFVGDAYSEAYDGRALTLMPGAQRLDVERVVALPVLRGLAIPGLPNDTEGFVRVDAHGRAVGIENVYAAGDATTFAIKQGGIAAQHADVVAALVARAAGIAVPEPSTRPLLRAVLFTGGAPLYLQATITGGESVASSASRHSPWWPPHKVAARHLAPYLADREEAGGTSSLHQG